MDILEVAAFGILGFVILPLIYYHIVDFILTKYGEYTGKNFSDFEGFILVFIYLTVYLLSKKSSLNVYLQIVLVPVIVSIAIIVIASFFDRRD
jgi:hypothetical protein